MASIWKRKSERRDPNANWNISYRDERGQRLTVTGCSDRRATEEIARKLESEVALRRRGVVSPVAERIVEAARVPIAEHIPTFVEFVRAQKPSGHAVRYIRQVEARVRAFAAFAEIGTLPEITPTGSPPTWRPCRNASAPNSPSTSTLAR